MVKKSFLKFVFVFIAILITTGIGYAGWKTWGGVEKVENQGGQALVKEYQPQKEVSESIAKTKKAETSEIDTSGWRIYRNNQYRYEISYPPGSTIRNYGLNTILIDIGAGAVPFSVKVIPNPQRLSAKQWVEQLKAKAHRQEDVPLPIEQIFPEKGPQEGPVQVGTVSGYRLRVFAIDYEKDLFFLSSAEFMYELGLSAVDPNDPEFDMHHRIFIRMLETFRLVSNS